MAATMLARLAKQTTRLTCLVLRQPLVASCLRPFSASANLFANKVYTEKHEWIQLDGQDNVGTVGISEYAQGTLGEIVFVGLREVGDEVEQNEEAGCVESVKAASEIYSPVAGKIVAVNEALIDKPQLVNESPLENGWLFKLKVADPADLNSLMDEDAYSKLVASQE